MGRKPSQMNYLQHVKMSPASGSAECHVKWDDIQRTDVLLGKDKMSQMHIGNAAFRALIDSRVDTYRFAESRSDKIHIVVSITNTIYDGGGRFLIAVGTGSETWAEVNQAYAREKVGNSIRDGVKLINKGRTRQNTAQGRFLFSDEATFLQIVEVLDGQDQGADGSMQTPSPPTEAKRANSGNGAQEKPTKKKRRAVSPAERAKTLAPPDQVVVLLPLEEYGVGDHHESYPAELNEKVSSYLRQASQSHPGDRYLRDEVVSNVAELHSIEKLPEFDDDDSSTHSGEWTTDDEDGQEQELLVNNAKTA
jgi:hypothetical protein